MTIKIFRLNLLRVIHEEYQITEVQQGDTTLAQAEDYGELSEQ
jgi:hypothetical protein